MKKIMVAVMAVMFFVGINAVSFAGEMKGDAKGGEKKEMKGDAKGGEKKAEKKEEKKK
jgi:hypothetical protein